MTDGTQPTPADEPGGVTEPVDALDAADPLESLTEDEDADEDDVEGGDEDDVEGDDEDDELDASIADDGDGDVPAVTVAVGFDDDDIVAAVTDDDDEEIEGIRDGEFVCRGCYMAKRETQLADPERMLCRDCS